MIGSDGSGIPYPRFPHDLNLEQARRLDQGNALYHLQQSYQTLSQEVTHLATDLREVLTHVRGGRAKGPKSASPSAHPTSFQKQVHPRRERRQPRQQVDPFKGLNLDPLEFGESLSPNLLIEWIRVLEWIFAFQGYSEEEAFKVAVLKLKGIASLWYENIQRQRVREGKARIRTWSKFQKLMAKRFLPTNSKHDLYFGVSSSSQECLVEKEDKKECEPLQIRREDELIPEVTHLTSSVTVEEKQEEAATVLLVQVDTLKEHQSLLNTKESIQEENQEKRLTQPRCSKPVQVTQTPLITSCVSDLKEGVDYYILPMDSCQARGARHLVKGATHQGWPKVCLFKLVGQAHSLKPLLFARTVWDQGVRVEVFIEQPWDLRTNPFEEGESDAWGIPSQCPRSTKVEGAKNKGL